MSHWCHVGEWAQQLGLAFCHFPSLPSSLLCFLTKQVALIVGNSFLSGSHWDSVYLISLPLFASLVKGLYLIFLSPSGSCEIFSSSTHAGDIEALPVSLLMPPVLPRACAFQRGQGLLWASTSCWEPCSWKTLCTMTDMYTVVCKQALC